MNRCKGTVIAAVCALGVSACSPQTQTQTAAPAPTIQSSVTSTEKGGSRRQAITMTAIVEKIDVAQRLVTLRGPNGKSKTIRVSDEARNLAQVEPGDEVAVTYYESIAYQVLAPGEKKPGISAEGGAGRAELGDKPGGLAAQAVTLVADVEELDRANQVAVLRGPEDQMITVNVQRPEVFDKVKVGDRVEITYTEAIAVDVQPKSAK